MSTQDLLDSPSACRERRSSGGSRHRDVRRFLQLHFRPERWTHPPDSESQQPGRQSARRQAWAAAARRSTLRQRRAWRTLGRTRGDRFRGTQLLCPLQILGPWDSPTKLDKEVLSALEGVDVDPLKFPSIQKWKSTMKSYSASDHAEVSTCVSHRVVHQQQITHEVISRRSLSEQSWPSPGGGKTTPQDAAADSRLSGSSLMSPAGRFSPVRHAASPDFSPSRYSPANASYIQRIRLKHLTDSTI
ncbi:unnamed protein product [Lampetra planeri]